MTTPRFIHFIFLLLGAGCLLISCQGTTRVDESGSETVEEPAAGPQERADDLLEEARDAQRLRAQKNEVLIDNFLETARRYRDRGELENARDAVLRALEVDPEDAEALRLYNELGRLLGDAARTAQDVKAILANRYKVAQEAQRAEARRHYDEGLEQLEQGEYDPAIRNFERVLAIAKWNPYADVSFDELREQAEARLEEARAGKRTADAERAEELARRTFEELQEEERRLAREQAQAIERLIKEGYERFRRREHDEAIAVAERVLDIDPGHAAAIDLLHTSREARHGKFETEILEQKRERFIRWLETVREKKIPQHEILRWADREYWDEITRRRASAPGAVPLEEESEAVARIKNQLENFRVNLDFDDAPVDAVIDYLRSITNINMVIDPEVQTELEAAGTTVNLKLNDIPVGQALNVLLASEEGLTYTFNNDVLLITQESKSFGTPIVQFHDVRDIAFGLADFEGPEIELTTGEEDADDPIPEYGREETREPEITADDLIELVRTSISPGTWDGNPGSIDIQSGRLLVVHVPDVQRDVTKFLNGLRKFRGISVTVETRFLTVRDNFLEDVGVDFRGLGGEKGSLADLDDVTNGLEDNASAGVDNSGGGLPGAAGGNPSSGAFFDDGGDGDYRGRTENIFDNALGTLLSSTGGLSLQFAYLDDLELNAVLRAVKKTDRATLLTAPVITAYDTQKSSIHMINQVAFIEDYEVEVAQTAFIADPVVGVIQDGIVFDVRPTVSHDRKWITLDLNPTVASLVRPIPTFTTNLGGLTFPVTLELPELRVSRAGTTVVVPDGGTVVIGGLKQISSVDRKSGTPVLSDIPVLRFLFSRKGKSEETEDLILIVTATINDIVEAEEALGIGGSRAGR